MDGLGAVIVIGFLLWVVYNTAYKSGKREGSRKGFGVGFDRGRKSGNSGGCMVSLIVLATLLAGVITLTSVGCDGNTASDHSISQSSSSAGTDADDIRSLPALMQEHGKQYSSISAAHLFVEQASTEELDVDLSGKFEIPEIPVYYIRRNDDPTSTEVLCKCVVSFRIYKSRSFESEKYAGLSGSLNTLTVCRANLMEAWFLTKDSQLRRCQNLMEVFVVRNNGGYIYVPEAKYSEIVFRGSYDAATAEALKGLPLNSFDRKSKTPARAYRAKIVIEDLGFTPALQWQESWGLYQHAALEQNDWDSDFLMNWNYSGALTGMIPEYFHPSDSENPQVVSARLVSFELIGPDKKVLGSYHQPDAE